MKYLLAAISLLLLVIIIAGGAFYFGQQTAQRGKEMTTTPTPTPFVTQEIPVATISLIPGEEKQTLSGGGVLVFNAYTLEALRNWTSAAEKDQDLDRLTLSYNGYSIKIFQAATGGALCLYPSDPDVEGPSSRFISFVDLTSKDGKKLRRGTTGAQNAMTVCESKSGNWEQPTSFGHISYQTPANPDAKIMDEMDDIVSSLKKK
ncbi:MAG: hypothetical protein HY344_01415 [Candidatus Levybacteria bacterium]|nr:hypothetical protein [Candidatus Levybacteria bacterium]